MPTFRYQTPGVHYERLDASTPAVSAIRTDVAGFVGLARRGPLDTAVPVQSWRQFKTHFGGFTGAGFLAYAVRGFFENGGRRCWVVRVASKETAGGARAASTLVHLGEPSGGASSGPPAWRIAASSPGIWGNGLSVRLRETHPAQTASDPDQSTPEATAVPSTSGFSRYSLCRISQEGADPIYRVVSEVDPYEGVLHWVHPDTDARTPYDRPLQGFDPDRFLLIERVAYTMRVYDRGKRLRIYEDLSLVPEHERYGPRLLAPLSVPRSIEREGKLPPTPEPIVIEELRPTPVLDFQPLAVSRDRVLVLEEGADGLALIRPYDFMGEPVDPRDSDVVKARKQRGFRALTSVDEVAAITVPDLHVQPLPPVPEAPVERCEPDPCLTGDDPPPAPPRTPKRERTEAPPSFSEEEIFRVQDALVQHCEERRDRIAILGPPVAAAVNEQEGVRTMLAWRERFASSFAALYWPWLRVVDPLRQEGRPGPLTRDIPPGGHVAGQIARSDFEVGAHRAPANTPLEWVQGVTIGTDEAEHGSLNTAGINVIRTLPGRGLRILGARTLGSGAPWHYLNVRRLLLMIAEAIYASVQWAVFEPNDAFTRAKLQHALTSFLLALWQQGALVGGTAEEAFFVKCDADNNPPFQRERGRLLAEVGMAPSQPYEFVVVRVGRAGNEFEIAESLTKRRGA